VFFGKWLPCWIIHGVCHQIPFVFYSKNFLRAELVLIHYSAIDIPAVSTDFVINGFLIDGVVSASVSLPKVKYKASHFQTILREDSEQ
jgi:hypothetical protein